MPEIDEPELHVIKFAAGVGAEWRAKMERQRSEARTRYLAHLTRELTESEAVIALDALTSWSDVTSGERCACSCHPRLPESDFHDYGFGCPCRQTADERRRDWDEWMAEEEEFRASPEGERITSARKAEEDELAAWLSLHPDIVVR